MKTISSSEFRKTYPRLTEGCSVMADGRYIGTWMPVVFSAGIRDQPMQEMRSMSIVVEHPEDYPQPATRDYILGALRNPRPFTPVPKPKRK